MQTAKLERVNTSEKSVVKNLAWPLAALSAAAVAGLGWAAGIEPHLFKIRRYTVPLLAPGSADIKVLHLSDLHLCPWQKHKMRWVNALINEQPDLVVNTGDNLSANIPDRVVDTYGDLLDVPGVFVLGSNDFFSPTKKNPAAYLTGPSKVRHRSSPDLDVQSLVDSFTARNWQFLDNRNTELTINGTRISFSGLGDAHINRDRISAIQPHFSPDAGLNFGVTHAPYLRTLDAFAEAGADLVLAGHTHGGQLRIPFWGAPVTNCDLDRTRARGVFEFGPTTVEVSAGLGFSPYAPVRFSCPPEVSVLTLTAN